MVPIFSTELHEDVLKKFTSQRFFISYTKLHFFCRHSDVCSYHLCFIASRSIISDLLFMHYVMCQL